MRQRFAITYDITDDRRRRHLRRWLRGFGHWHQLSVFICDLTPPQLALLRVGIQHRIEPQHDQVLLFNLGPTTGRARQATTCLGLPRRPDPARPKHMVF